MDIFGDRMLMKNKDCWYAYKLEKSQLPVLCLHINKSTIKMLESLSSLYHGLWQQQASENVKSENQMVFPIHICNILIGRMDNC